MSQLKRNVKYCCVDISVCGIRLEDLKIQNTEANKTRVLEIAGQCQHDCIPFETPASKTHDSLPEGNFVKVIELPTIIKQNTVVHGLTKDRHLRFCFECEDISEEGDQAPSSPNS